MRLWLQDLKLQVLECTWINNVHTTCKIIVHQFLWCLINLQVGNRTELITAVTSRKVILLYKLNRGYLAWWWALDRIHPSTITYREHSHSRRSWIKVATSSSHLPLWHHHIYTISTWALIRVQFLTIIAVFLPPSRSQGDTKYHLL